MAKSLLGRFKRQFLKLLRTHYDSNALTLDFQIDVPVWFGLETVSCAASVWSPSLILSRSSETWLSLFFFQVALYWGQKRNTDQLRLRHMLN